MTEEKEKEVTYTIEICKELAERINKLTPEHRKMFWEDIHTTIENRIVVLERAEQ